MSDTTSLFKVTAPTSLVRKAPDVLVITWNDGAVSEFHSRFLRSSCPCAACVNEWTGEKMLDEARIPKDILPVRLISVGRYAMSIHWSDGHKTGIYAYDYLRKLNPGK
jgi:DUF971 family protein